jgi:hypothetical protein
MQRRHFYVIWLERDAPSPLDARLLGWLTEGAGYRIRNIPTTFPDLLRQMR